MWCGRSFPDKRIFKFLDFCSGQLHCCEYNKQIQYVCKEIEN